MCSIIASFSKNKIQELAAINAYRGQHSHSIYVFKDYQVVYSHRDFGPLIMNDHDLPEGYIVCHQQAPTTDNKNIESIHPAQIGPNLLWHNGIIKEDFVKKLQKDLESTNTWDTKLLLQHLIYYEEPAKIDGTFSCIWFDGYEMMVFRNEISPLFYDKEMNISSTKFDNSESLAPNIIHFLTYNEDLKLTLTEGPTFETVENPYYFGG